MNILTLIDLDPDLGLILSRRAVRSHNRRRKRVVPRDDRTHYLRAVVQDIVINRNTQCERTDVR